MEIEYIVRVYGSIFLVCVVLLFIVIMAKWSRQDCEGEGAQGTAKTQSTQNNSELQPGTEGIQDVRNGGVNYNKTETTEQSSLPK